MNNDLISRSALEKEGFTHFIRVTAGGKVVRSKKIAEAPAVDAGGSGAVRPVQALGCRRAILPPSRRFELLRKDGSRKGLLLFRRTEG